MKAHVDHVVHCKLLKLQGLHTFVVMIGYHFKDVRKEHFKVVHVKVFNVEKNVNIDEYTKFGVTFTKNHVVLSNINIIDLAFAWCKN
jgi:hypothetical protein